MKHIDGEIIVVDNASVDGTPQQVRQHFPDVHLIANHDNRGFAKANNQGISLAKGEFILLLNPDTIVSGDTFSTCIRFMETHPDAGAIGVKMIDGSGRFLPESKRGLPTLSASFMKMTGLYRIFPHSATWNQYYQGQISENETAKVDVLCGAFMFIKKAALDASGYLDEDFFMYGEDIDLSYRITKAGYAIYYLPDTSIIHYKGESTRKSSLNYILTFYQAMLIFTQKHPEFSGQKVLIQLAIYFHGLLQLIRQNVTRWWPVVMDAILVSSSFFLVSKGWALYSFGSVDHFKPEFYYFNIPLYTAIMLLALYLNGAYDKPFTKRSSWLGFFSGVVMILMIYAMLPMDFRTSRAWSSW
jgi:GT2 family glycosyltransferase